MPGNQAIIDMQVYTDNFLMIAELCSIFSWENAELLNQVVSFTELGPSLKGYIFANVEKQVLHKIMPGVNFELKMLPCQADEQTSTLLRCLKSQ